MRSRASVYPPPVPGFEVGLCSPLLEAELRGGPESKMGRVRRTTWIHFGGITALALDGTTLLATSCMTGSTCSQMDRPLIGKRFPVWSPERRPQPGDQGSRVPRGE